MERATRAFTESGANSRSRAKQGGRQKLIASLPVKERRLTLNGVTTSVLEGGEGAPIVLLHGPVAYGAHFFRVIPALASGHRVIAPDLPGHGGSAFFQGELTSERVAGWLDDLIECTCSQSPVLVGHTLGGAIAARYTAESGRKLHALVLVDTLGLVDFQPEAAFGAALQAFMQRPGEETHDGLWSQCAFDLERLRQRLGEPWQWIREANLEGIRTFGVSTLIPWMQEFGSAIPPELLARIGSHTTLIWGREDRATPLAVAEAASRRYGWPLQVIDGAADDPTIEQPEEFVAALRAVLMDRTGVV
jgi:pimeloyl-ACP methyl ester carboxylesterase